MSTYPPLHILGGLYIELVSAFMSFGSKTSYKIVAVSRLPEIPVSLKCVNQLRIIPHYFITMLKLFHKSHVQITKRYFIFYIFILKYDYKRQQVVFINCHSIEL